MCSELWIQLRSENIHLRSWPSNNTETSVSDLPQLITDELLPVDLSVLVKVLQAFQHILQHRGYGGLVQDAGLVFPSGDDVFDHIQHRAWILTTTEKRFALAVLRFAG